MSGIMRLVIDVQKPINLPSVVLAVELSKAKGVDAVDLQIEEVEHRVESAKVLIEGDNIDMDKIKAVIEKIGASIQGIDRISCGKRRIG